MNIISLLVSVIKVISLLLLTDLFKKEKAIQKCVFGIISPNSFQFVGPPNRARTHHITTHYCGIEIDKNGVLLMAPDYQAHQ